MNKLPPKFPFLDRLGVRDFKTRKSPHIGGWWYKRYEMLGKWYSIK
jgi:hypothetical protein